MARDLITPKKCTEMSTAVVRFSTASGMVLISTANGAYIKTGGTSNIDATRLLFVVTRKSSKQQSTGYISVVSGSTKTSVRDFEAIYSTARNLIIAMPDSTGTTRMHSIHFFKVPETARFKDSDGYIKFNFSTALGRNGSASQNQHIGCLYLKA